MQISVGIFSPTFESAAAADNMGEDVWSLVSRQLNSRNTDAGRKEKNETKDGEDGERKTPGGEENPSNADDESEAAAARCAFTSFALCVGMPGSGKSTLLNAYLNPSNDSVPKPTVALEYMFARRASAANMPKVRKGKGRSLVPRLFRKTQTVSTTALKLLMLLYGAASAVLAWYRINCAALISMATRFGRSRR